MEVLIWARQMGVGQVLSTEWLPIIVKAISQVTGRLQRDKNPLLEALFFFFFWLMFLFWLLPFHHVIKKNSNSQWMNHVLRAIQEIDIRRLGEDSFQGLLVRVHLCAYVWQECVEPEKAVTGNDAAAGARCSPLGWRHQCPHLCTSCRGDSSIF